MSQSSFCRNCREDVALEPGATICPTCGTDLFSLGVANTGNTVTLHSTDLPLPAADSPPGTRATAVADKPNGTDPLIGTDLDVYQIGSLLGRGGMGTVYLAWHRDLHRRCALKILSPQRAAEDRDYIDRFRHEGRAAAGLVHPNIVTIHAIGETNALHFLEMEFVAGPTLQQLLRAEGQINPVRSTEIAARIADGLATAHRAGIIHRDLKPDNVLLTHQGVPKLADFGLAKRINDRSTPHAMEGLMGTPNFMAPELFAGGSADTATDVYALGVTYYLMLTGKFPHPSGSLPTLISSVATEPIPNARAFSPDITLEMSECLNILLSKNPLARPRSGIEAAQLLHAILGQVQDLDSILSEAFVEDPSVTWARQGNGYRLELWLEHGRHQTLFIEPSAHAATDRLLLISSICGPAEPAYYEYALRLNSEIPHGGLAIREIDGKPQFVMVDTYPRSTVDPEEVRRSVLEMATRADHIEKLLTGLDLH